MSPVVINPKPIHQGGVIFGPNMQGQGGVINQNCSNINQGLPGVPLGMNTQNQGGIINQEGGNLNQGLPPGYIYHPGYYQGGIMNQPGAYLNQGWPGKFYPYVQGNAGNVQFQGNSQLGGGGVINQAGNKINPGKLYVGYPNNINQWRPVYGGFGGNGR